MPGATQTSDVSKKGAKAAAPAPAADGLADTLVDPLTVPAPVRKVAAETAAAADGDEGLAAAKRPLDETGDASKWKTGKVETQSSKHLAILYEQAAVALLGLGSETERVAGSTNGTPKVCSELKGRKRAIEKIEADYDGHPERLLDLARASIYYDDDASLKAGVAEVGNSMEVVREKNNFANPMGGYRDYNFNIRIGGHICELQLHLTKILDAKAKGHEDYEVVRSIEARAKKGEALSDEDLAVLASKKADMWKLYNDAYADAGGEVSEEHRAKEPKRAPK